MITTAGIIIQIRMNEINVHGRVTSGVKLINLDEGVTVAQIAKVREKVVTDGNTEVDLGEGTDEEPQEETEEEISEETEETEE